ncbi:hypothetical protein [Aurantibacter sp.]|uniref:hypothetical protein n=1 Tax=Aurantibacter sp. TaxID=2807103 RepID=UPI003264D64B
MKNTLFFRQKKPIIAPILGAMFILICLIDFIGEKTDYTKILVLVIFAVLLFGYTVSYEITKEYVNFRHFKLFGFTLLKSKLNIVFPDYISVFSAKYKRSAEWGPVAAMGKEQSGDSLVIQLFAGKKHFTIYRTNSLKKAKGKAAELSDLLRVKLES